MPLITLEFGGRITTEQKKAVVKDITEAFAKNVQIPPEGVMISIVEYKLDQRARGGKLETEARRKDW